MRSTFIKNNSGSILVIVILLLLWGVLSLFNQKHNTEQLLKEPQVLDVYVFGEQNKYAPMRLDSIGDQHYFMRNYMFYFEDALPNSDQIKSDEFDLSIFAIYDKKELKRLYEDGLLKRIYRD